MAWTKPARVAAPRLPVRPKAITSHIIYRPPARAPLGIIKGVLTRWARGTTTGFKATPKAAMAAISSSSRTVKPAKSFFIAFSLTAE